MRALRRVALGAVALAAVAGCQPAAAPPPPPPPPAPTTMPPLPSSPAVAAPIVPTTTTTSRRSTTSRTTTPRRTTTTTRSGPVVHPGAFCATPGAVGVADTDGHAVRCRESSDGRDRWGK